MNTAKLGVLSPTSEYVHLTLDLGARGDSCLLYTDQETDVTHSTKVQMAMDVPRVWARCT